MSTQALKLDSGLRLELARAERLSDDSSRIPVIIVYEAPMSAGPAEDLAGLEQRQKPVRDKLRGRLAAIGVTDKIEELSLVNGLAVRLSPGQIRTLAADPLVKQMLSNKEERVIP